MHRNSINTKNKDMEADPRKKAILQQLKKHKGLLNKI